MKTFKVYLVETTAPHREILLGEILADNDGHAIAKVKTANASIINRLECGPQAYTYKAKAI
jgi:hypothetical protein